MAVRWVEALGVSFDAIKWALRQDAPSSACKLVLIALADCVNKESALAEAWPSYAAIEQVTQLNRKTIVDAVAKLVDAELIRDTGRKVGATQQVKIYSLAVGNDTKNGTLPGILKQSLNRNSSKNGTIPKTDGTVPFLRGTVPKTGLGTSKNQEGISKGGGKPLGANKPEPVKSNGRPATIYDLDDMKKAKKEAIDKLRLKHYRSGPLGGWFPPEKESIFKRLKAELDDVEQRRSEINP